MTPTLLPMLLTALLGSMPVDPQAGDSELTTLRLSLTGATWNVTWNDTEDVLRGSIASKTFRVGEPMVLSLNVNSYAGGAFTGPVTVTLRPLTASGSAYSESHTIERGAKDHLWTVTLTPREAGEHRLEVSYRTTHFKSVRGVIEVEEPHLPAWFGPLVAAALILVAVGAGAWLVSRGAGSDGGAEAGKSDPPA
jgi:hypothetical protein